jgi:hypothetical protein
MNFGAGLRQQILGAGIELTTTLALMPAVKYSGFHQAFGYVA